MHTLGRFACRALSARVLQALSVYAMLIHKFGPLFCISVFFEKGIMKLTLPKSLYIAS